MAIGSGTLALAMLVSISEGLCLEGLLGAILFRALADMSAAGEVSCRLVEGKEDTTKTVRTNCAWLGGPVKRRQAHALARTTWTDLQGPREHQHRLHMTPCHSLIFRQ